MEKIAEDWTSEIYAVYKIVEDACKKPSNEFGYGIWSHHIQPMVPIARTLAQQFGADEEIVIIATLLHDLAGIQNAKDKSEHHLIGAIRAEEILRTHNYPPERIIAVQQCIHNHRGSINNHKSTLEEICVADADAIVHMTELASLFYAAYKELDMDIDNGKIWVKEKIQRDWDKMSEQSKALFEHKYRAILEVLS
jgi:HD superfamily phosphodiesterase